MNSTKKIKIALVHDDFIQFGGAEKLFWDLILEFSKDPRYDVVVFSSLISEKWKKIFENEEIFYIESFLKNFPFCYHVSKIFFIFEMYYLAFQSFDFDSFDFVISSSTRYSHSVITKPSTFHISYVNSLPKMFWDPEKYFAGKKFGYFILSNFFPYFQKLDLYTQKLSDLVITNSKNIQTKYKKNISRNSVILYPFIPHPLINQEFSPLLEKNDFYLLISRLVSWKRIDYVLDTFSELKDKKIIVVGEGPELNNYSKKYKSQNILFLGRVSEDKKTELLTKSKGVIFPQDEDFGLVILESLKCKTPIIYFNKGGAKEILNKSVGVSYDFQNKNALIRAIQENDSKLYKIEDFNKISSNFSKPKFLNFLKSFIEVKYKNSSRT